MIYCILQEINNIHHGVRVECLKLIGQLSHVSGDAAKPLAVLEDYCNDADPRVRTAALDALVRIPVFSLFISFLK